jgi:hypothetical protein
MNPNMQMIIESTTKNSPLAGDEILMQSNKYLQFRTDMSTPMELRQSRHGTKAERQQDLYA